MDKSTSEMSADARKACVDIYMAYSVSQLKDLTPSVRAAWAAGEQIRNTVIRM